MIQLPDGSITFAKSDTNGATSLGESVPLHSGTMRVDGLPNIKKLQPTSQKPIPKSKTSLVKVLFSVLKQDTEDFYIGGDSEKPRKIYTLVRNTGFIYCGFTNTGDKLNDWVLAFQKGINEFTASETLTITLTNTYIHSGLNFRFQGERLPLFYKEHGFWALVFGDNGADDPAEITSNYVFSNEKFYERVVATGEPYAWENVATNSYLTPTFTLPSNYYLQGSPSVIWNTVLEGKNGSSAIVLKSNLAAFTTEYFLLNNEQFLPISFSDIDRLKLGKVSIGSTSNPLTRNVANLIGSKIYNPNLGYDFIKKGKIDIEVYDFNANETLIESIPIYAIPSGARILRVAYHPKNAT